MDNRSMSRVGLLAMTSVLVAAAHGAVLKSSLSSVEAGRVLPLQGQDFHEGTFSLVLVGVFEEHTLRDVDVGESGTFSVELEISANLRPGQYQVVAFSAEGEREAALDVSVAVATAAAEMDHSDAAENGEAVDAGARAEEMAIERSMAGASWGIIGLFIGLAGGLGTVLVKRSPLTEV